MPTFESQIRRKESRARRGRGNSIEEKWKISIDPRTLWWMTVRIVSKGAPTSSPRCLPDLGVTRSFLYFPACKLQKFLAPPRTNRAVLPSRFRSGALPGSERARGKFRQRNNIPRISEERLKSGRMLEFSFASNFVRFVRSFETKTRLTSFSQGSPVSFRISMQYFRYSPMFDHLLFDSVKRNGIYLHVGI